MYRQKNKIHFVGIGGSGMSGIAEVLLNLGHEISGSDLEDSPVVQHLRELGARIFLGHSPDNIEDVDVVVKSTAVPMDNPEIKEALRRKIPVIPRAEMLAELMRIKYSIAVAGTHGKTTTTSLIAAILYEDGQDPTIVIGGRLNQLSSGAKLGKGEYIVAEADESDGSFLKLMPTVSVITNIDEDHLDFYKDIGEIKNCFLEFINRVPFYGFAVLNLDDENVQNLIPYVTKKYVTYGLKSRAMISADNIKISETGTVFTLRIKGEDVDEVFMNIYGIHNVYNALAAIATARELGVDLEIVKSAFKKFSGVERRFQKVYEDEKLIIIDDYGHHPREIEMTLKAARTIFKGKIITVFQPHRFTRTYHLHDAFGRAFFDSDEVIIMDIYPAGEAPISGVTGKLIVDDCIKYGQNNVSFVPESEEVVEILKDRVNSSSEKIMIITIGAGNIYKIGKELVKHL